MVGRAEVRGEGSRPAGWRPAGVRLWRAPRGRAPRLAQFRRTSTYQRAISGARTDDAAFLRSITKRSRFSVLFGSRWAVGLDEENLSPRAGVTTPSSGSVTRASR